jgi:hypothetical protein
MSAHHNLLPRRSLLHGAAGLLGLLPGLLVTGKTRRATAAEPQSPTYDLPLPRQDELVSSQVLLTASEDPISLFRLYYAELPLPLPLNFGLNAAQAVAGVLADTARKPMLTVMDGRPDAAFNRLSPYIRDYPKVLGYGSLSTRLALRGRWYTVPMIVCNLSDAPTVEYVRAYLTGLLLRSREEQFQVVVKHVYRWVADVTA